MLQRERNETLGETANAKEKGNEGEAEGVTQIEAMTVISAAPDVIAGVATAAAVQAAGLPGAFVETSTASLADDVRHSWQANFEVLELQQQQLVIKRIKRQLPQL